MSCCFEADGKADPVIFVTTSMKFPVRLLLFSAVLFAGGLAVRDVVPERFRYDGTPFLFLFFVVLMLVFNWWVHRPVRTPGGLVPRYLGATVVKFLVCLAVLAVYVLTHRGQAVAFTLHFLALYFVYTVFEVALLYREFKAAAA